MSAQASISHRRLRDGESTRPRLPAIRPWTLALAVAAPLALVYLIASPPAGDLAAATYRSDLFARVGFSTWDTGWYAAHGYWLPSYSLLSPALGALLGVHALLALSAIVAAALFASIAEHLLPLRPARAAAAVFALGFCVGLLSGRVPFDLGFALGLGAVLALLRGRAVAALALALLCAAASPVAGAFLALAGLAGAIGSRLTGGLTGDVRHCLALAATALLPILALSLAYPNGGYEPFATGAFWPALAAVALTAVLLPRGPLTARAHTVLRVGGALYALALIAAYAIHTPMGGNAARLGPLLAPPLLAGVLWDGTDRGARRGRRRETPARRGPRGSSRRRGQALLLALAPALLYWQLATAIKDFTAVAGDPSVKASYYAPLLAELRHLTGGRPAIVEVPMTNAHWESVYLPWHDGVRLARGWERQLDTRYAALFYRPTLSATDYRAWLATNRVRYVALPDAALEDAGAGEGRLIADGLPYLRELWRSRHWRLYAFGD